MTSKEELKKKQVEMHFDIIERIDGACAAGCFFEAVFLEYAAIEGRMEVILGLLGMPCNKNISVAIRKEIKISSRIECLRYIYRQRSSAILETTKIKNVFFEKNGVLSKWIKDRNILVHGLAKDAMQYFDRQEVCHKVAESGQSIVRQLYNEAKRIDRLIHKTPDIINAENFSCKNDNCKANPNKKD